MSEDANDFYELDFYELSLELDKTVDATVEAYTKASLPALGKTVMAAAVSTGVVLLLAYLSRDVMLEAFGYAFPAWPWILAVGATQMIVGMKFGIHSGALGIIRPILTEQMKHFKEMLSVGFED